MLYLDNSIIFFAEMPELNFSPFPIIVSERLILRELQMEDANEVFILRSDSRILEHLDKDPYKTIEEAWQFIQKILNGISAQEWISWGISLKDDPKLIGSICLWNLDADKNKADIGYELLPEYWGKGYVHEAVKKVLDYGYGQMKLDIVEAEVAPNNINSIKVLHRYHFTWKHETEKGQSIYSLTKDEFEITS